MLAIIAGYARKQCWVFAECITTTACSITHIWPYLDLSTSSISVQVSDSVCILVTTSTSLWDSACSLASVSPAALFDPARVDLQLRQELLCLFHAVTWPIKYVDTWNFKCPPNGKSLEYYLFPVMRPAINPLHHKNEEHSHDKDWGTCLTTSPFLSTTTTKGSSLLHVSLQQLQISVSPSAGVQISWCTAHMTHKADQFHHLLASQHYLNIIANTCTKWGCVPLATAVLCMESPQTTSSGSHGRCREDFSTRDVGDRTALILSHACRNCHILSIINSMVS